MSYNEVFLAVQNLYTRIATVIYNVLSVSYKFECQFTFKFQLFNLRFIPTGIAHFVAFSYLVVSDKPSPWSRHRRSATTTTTPSSTTTPTISTSGCDRPTTGSNTTTMSRSGSDVMLRPPTPKFCPTDEESQSANPVGIRLTRKRNKLWDTN